MAITQLQATDRVADWLARTNEVIDEINNGVGNRQALSTNDKTIVGAINEIAGPGAVGTINLADGAVTTPKIADGAVTAEKLAENLILPGTGWTKLPSGTTAQRPVQPEEGYIRYNTDFASYEQFTDIGWLLLVGAPIGTGVTPSAVNDAINSQITLTGTGFTEDMRIWAINPNNNNAEIIEMTNVTFISYTTVTFTYPATANPISANINEIGFKIQSGATNLSSIVDGTVGVLRGPIFATPSGTVIAEYNLR
jgi:hypothetical protein